MIGIGVPILAGFIYFTVARKDKTKFDTQSNVRSDEEAERDKQELARKVKKELQDEAEKVEKIRKDVAVDVKEETNKNTEQKIRETKSEFSHQIEMYEERNSSKFIAMEKVNDNLMAKIVDTSKIQADALLKINDSIEALRKLFYEMAGKISRVEREQDKQGGQNR